MSFRHKGLTRLYEEGDVRGLPPEQLSKIREILADLDAAAVPGDLDRPGYRLHSLRGPMKGRWSVRVTANWRIVFWMSDAHGHDVDLVDYH